MHLTKSMATEKILTINIFFSAGTYLWKDIFPISKMYEMKSN